MLSLLLGALSLAGAGPCRAGEPAPPAALRPAFAVPRARLDLPRLSLGTTELPLTPLPGLLLPGPGAGPAAVPAPADPLLGLDLSGLSGFYDGADPSRPEWLLPPPEPVAGPRGPRPRAGPPSSGWWTPLISFVPGGAVVGVQIGRAAPSPYPSGAVPGPGERAGLLRDREERLATPTWTALAVAAGGTLTLRLAKTLGWLPSPEPNVALDTALDFLVAYGLGSTLAPGEVHRDIGLGFLNGLAYAGTRAIAAAVRKEPAEDPRYDIIAFQLVYAVHGALPWRGNPLPTDGRDTGGAVANAFSDTAVHAAWTGLAGGLGGLARAARGGRPAGPAFLDGLAWGAGYGAVTRGLTNAVLGPRLRLDEGIWDESREIAARETGMVLRLPRDGVDVRAGGLQDLMSDWYLAGTWPDFISIKRPSLLDAGLLAHERTHLESQVLRRGILGFYLPYVFGGWQGDEDWAYETDGD